MDAMRQPALACMLALGASACSGAQASSDSGLELIDLGTAADYDSGIELVDTGEHEDARPGGDDAGGGVDADSPDSSIPDAFITDLGAPDTGATDTGAHDSGAPDTGLTRDGAVPDSGLTRDGGPDSGLFRDGGSPASDGGVRDTGAIADSGPACSIIIDTTACSMCVEQYCCTELEACNADPTCSFEFTSCYASCRTSGGSVMTCGNQCFSSPQGVALRSCTFTNCSQQCP
jgi:hypothetical protein